MTGKGKDYVCLVAVMVQQEKAVPWFHLDGTGSGTVKGQRGPEWALKNFPYRQGGLGRNRALLSGILVYVRSPQCVTGLECLKVHVMKAVNYQ